MSQIDKKSPTHAQYFDLFDIEGSNNPPVLGRIWGVAVPDSEVHRPVQPALRSRDKVSRSSFVSSRSQEAPSFVFSFFFSVVYGHLTFKSQKFLKRKFFEGIFETFDLFGVLWRKISLWIFSTLLAVCWSRQFWRLFQSCIFEIYGFSRC